MASDTRSAANSIATGPYRLTVRRRGKVCLQQKLKAENISAVWTELNRIASNISIDDGGTILVTEGAGHIVIRTGIRSLRVRSRPEKTGMSVEVIEHNIEACNLALQIVESLKKQVA